MIMFMSYLFSNKDTIKRYYERFLSDFGIEWLWFNFKSRVERTLQKMYERVLFVRKNKSLSAMFQFDLNTLFVRSDFKKIRSLALSFEAV